MNARFASYTLLTVALLATGFAGGWWLRGQTASEAELALNASTHAQPPQPVATFERPPAPASDAPRAQETSAGLNAGESASTSAKAPTSQALRTDHQQRFRELLAAQEFTGAMNLYRDIERRNNDAARELKALVLSHLQGYLHAQDAVALTGLVDAFLAYDYSDLDVLLLLSRYHQQSGYPSEAARTFQLAFTYAYDEAEVEQVEQAFQRFVDEVHQDLGDSDALVAFYESLALLDLNRPQYRLRLARLYLDQGHELWGQSLLEELVQVPAVASEAAQLLEQLRTTARHPAQKPADEVADTIALAVYGSHYHLPLRFNEREDARLLIDTGASTTTLSRASYERLSRYGGFTRVGPQIFNTANGPTKGTVYRVARLQLGQQQLQDVQVAVLDLEMPPGIDGLLGMNVLRNFRFELDQDGQQMVLRPRQ